MSKRNRRKHQPAQPQPPSQIFFTLPVVRMLKDAVVVFERMLLQKPDDLPNVPFAKEVVGGLKTKLDDMLQLEEWNKETSFDSNEVHVLDAAVHLYLIEWKFSQKDEGRNL